MGRRRHSGKCALCGKFSDLTEEHVVPKCLYPSQKEKNFKYIKVYSCVICNNGTSNDDAHLRNVLALAGDTTPVVKDLWDGPIRRGFNQPDGVKRAKDVYKIMEKALDLEGDQYKIFPARDPRILKSVVKIVKGLSFYHNIEFPYEEIQYFVDVCRFIIPKEFFILAKNHSANADVFEYFIYSDELDGEIFSMWVLSFYRRTRFFVAALKPPLKSSSFQVKTE